MMIIEYLMIIIKIVLAVRNTLNALCILDNWDCGQLIGPSLVHLDLELWNLRHYWDIWYIKIQVSEIPRYIRDLCWSPRYSPVRYLN